MKARTAVIAGVLAALLLMSVAVYFASSSAIFGNPDDYSPANSAWNGFSTLKSLERPTILQNLSGLPPDGAGLILLENGPSSPYTPAEARGVSSFVTSGGTLVVADDYGVANTLLSGMGLSSRFTGSLLVDPLYNFKNSYLVVVPSVSMRNVSSLAFNYATTLSVTDAGARVLGYSSDFSYINPTQRGGSVSGAPHGPFPVLAEIPDGAGMVYLIADDSVFINSMIYRDGNRNLLNDLSTGGMYLDTSHFASGPATVLRSLESSAYSVLSLSEFRYSLILVGLAGILAYRVGRRAEFEEEELKAVMQEHPEWNEEKLRRLEKELKG